MTSHLSALQARLSNERVRLANATTKQERDMRAVWVAQIEKEIAREQSRTWSDTPDGQSAARYFDAIEAGDDMSDDELLAALEA
jgi:hypothetical protein